MMNEAEKTGDFHKYKELKESFYSIQKTVKVDDCDHSHSHSHGHSSEEEECDGHKEHEHDDHPEIFTNEDIKNSSRQDDHGPNDMEDVKNKEEPSNEITAEAPAESHRPQQVKLDFALIQPLLLGEIKSEAESPVSAKHEQSP